MEKENNANICQNITTYCTEYRPYSILYKVDNDGVISWEREGIIDIDGGVAKIFFNYTATTVNEDCTSSSTVGVYEDTLIVPPIVCEENNEEENVCSNEDIRITNETSFVLPCEGGTINVPFEHEDKSECENSLSIHSDELPDFVKDADIDTKNSVITITVTENTTDKEKGGSINIYNNEKYWNTISIIVETNEKCQGGKKGKSFKSIENKDSEEPYVCTKKVFIKNYVINFKTATEGCSNIVAFDLYQYIKECEKLSMTNKEYIPTVIDFKYDFEKYIEYAKENTNAAYYNVDKIDKYRMTINGRSIKNRFSKLLEEYDEVKFDTHSDDDLRDILCEFCTNLTELIYNLEIWEYKRTDYAIYNLEKIISWVI